MYFIMLHHNIHFLQIGKVYYISRATLKTANKQFNNLKNDYEMSLTGDSEIIPCHDIGDKIPTLQFDFIPINDIEQKEKNDIIGKYCIEMYTIYILYHNTLIYYLLIITLICCRYFGYCKISW